METTKCVMILDESLPLGLLANTAAILGMTLGKLVPEAVGEDVSDASGRTHRGIVEIPVPILRADRERIRAIRETLYEAEYSGVIVADFSDVAQKCHVYEDYIRNIGLVGEGRLHYYGIGLCGAKKLINKLTGSMPLLR